MLRRKIRGDGIVSPSTCQHTSFLSILYDVIEPAHFSAQLESRGWDPGDTTADCPDPTLAPCNRSRASPPDSWAI